jgi:sulfane dehydrogenase subunit SoxC
MNRGTGQNGEPLTAGAGLPGAAVPSGWEGKHQHQVDLRRIEVATGPFMTREETSKYTDPLANGTARIFSFVMDAKSVITFPTFPSVLPDRGFWERSAGSRGAGRGRISRVDVSADGGRTLASGRAAGAGAAEVPHPFPLPCGTGTEARRS